MTQNSLCEFLCKTGSFSCYKVPFRVLWHFAHKASMTSVNVEANVHSADCLICAFVNELALPHVPNQQGQGRGQCMQQCKRIMKEICKNEIII